MPNRFLLQIPVPDCVSGDGSDPCITEKSAEGFVFIIHGKFLL
uniref:Uncharacterized protein n=1 Tax=uncultured bacterium Contigcl_7 TaxID=1393677 RepID=W0FRJ9_9BACT|nr:hypothetical protein [uncultured bacterium Contigcl_7]